MIIEGEKEIRFSLKRFSLGKSFLGMKKGDDIFLTLHIKLTRNLSLYGANFYLTSTLTRITPGPLLRPTINVCIPVTPYNGALDDTVRLKESEWDRSNYDTILGWLGVDSKEVPMLSLLIQGLINNNHLIEVSTLLTNLYVLKIYEDHHYKKLNI